METSISDFNKSFCISEIKFYHFTCHVYAFYGYTTVEIHAAKQLKAIDYSKICFGIILREW